MQSCPRAFAMLTIPSLHRAPTVGPSTIHTHTATQGVEGMRSLNRERIRIHGSFSGSGLSLFMLFGTSLPGAISFPSPLTWTQNSPRWFLCSQDAQMSRWASFYASSRLGVPLGRGQGTRMDLSPSTI